MNLRILAGVVSLGLFLAACAPEVGSERWCKAMSEKPKGDWSLNETGDYAKHCMFAGDEK